MLIRSHRQSPPRPALARLVPLVALAFVALPLGRAHAQDAGFDEATTDTLKAMAQQFADARSFTVKVTLDSKTAVGDRKRSNATTARFLIKRPDKYHIDFTSDGRAGLIVSDGRTEVVVHRAWAQYTQEKVAEDQPFAHQMLDLLLARTLVAEDPYAALKEMISGGRHAGREKVEGQAADRLVLDADAGELHLWVARGERRVPLKLRIQQEITMQGRARGSLDTKIDFEDWNLGADITDEAFDFEPGEMLTKVDRFEAPNPRTLIGKPAPDFTLATPGGRTVKLSDHLGKDVVILDFWATWCAPCIRGLPIVQGVYEQYSDRNIAFYAINVRESAEEVRAFEKKRGMDLPVLLDTDRGVANRYRAGGLPLTVIIGADGKVAAVHTGVTDDTEYKLKQEIKAAFEVE